jgi:hypothetical protein
MSSSRRRAGFAAGAAAVTAALALMASGGSTSAAGPDATPHHGHPSGGPAATGFQREMDESMARMMQDMHAPGYTGDADIDFLVMMVPHHAGAVDMARLVLQHGRDPATRQLAEEIIAGQTIEIESMTRRLQALRRGSSTASPSEFPALGGTRGP